MNAQTIVEQVSTTYELTSCGECDIRWAMSATFLSRRREDGKGFYCPNGHCRAYTETEATRLKKQLERAQLDLARSRESYAHLSTVTEQERKAHAATKGQLTKTRNRIAKGVCPECHRSFVNVARHMARHEATTPEQVHALNVKERRSIAALSGDAGGEEMR